MTGDKVEGLRQMALNDFLGGSEKDRELAESICHEVGRIEMADLTIAVFEIDEQIYIVRAEPNRTSMEVWES